MCLLTLGCSSPTRPNGSPQPSATAPQLAAASPIGISRYASTTAALMATPTPTGVDHGPLPSVSAPQFIGTLVGAKAHKSPPELQLYGTDLGLTFEHRGQLFMLFGDTWTSAESICEQEALPLQDDTMATLPLQFAGSVPPITFVTPANTPNVASNLHVFRGAAEELNLGYGQAPMGGWSDGEHSFAIFARLEPARCSEADAAVHGSAACGEGQVSFCSTDLGLCQPDYLSFPVPCDLKQSDACLPGQRCVETPLCIDPTSSQFESGSFLSESASTTFETEIAVARPEHPADFDSAFSWHTNKFSQPAVRTVQKFTAKRTGNDYTPGHDTLLVWGRPGFLGEHGRQASLYLMAHPLPMQLSAAGKLSFEPRYFAGIDATTGEPLWSDNEAAAQALALDGRQAGSTYEEESVIGPFTVSYLPAPIDRWVMLYGGDLADYLLSDPVGSRGQHAAGSIVMRFAEHPWGPWSSPQTHLAPGQPAYPGDAYGPAGFLYHPDCVDQGAQQCARSDPRRPLDTVLTGCPIAFPDPGRFYAPNVIDNYTTANATGGLDVVWNVSTWNPYAVLMFKTNISPASDPTTPAVPGALHPLPDDELSDQAGLEKLSDFRALPELPDGAGHYVQQSSYDRGTRDSTFPLSNYGNRDFNNFICASADTVLPEPQFAPFKFDLETCPESYVHGAVLSRFEGSGRMVRMWLGMQSLMYGPADDEVLRIYVDDEPTPRVDVPLRAALDGTAGEVFAPPFGAGSPRRLAWYYPVAFKHKLIVALDKLGPLDNYFYHCDAVLESEPSPALTTQRRPERDHAIRQLSAVYRPVGNPGRLREPDKLTLPARRSANIVMEDGPATIYELRLRYRERDADQLALVRVRVTWDDATAPAIDMPLLDLFAALPTPPEQSSQALSSFQDGADRVLALRLPAPYARRALFTFENTGFTSTDFEVRMLGEHAPLGQVGHLHAVRHETRSPTFATSHTAIAAQGRGRLVGVCGYWQGHADRAAGIQQDQLNLLEGDVNARIDGAPGLVGTGTEEYTDDVFYFTDAPHARAFEQAWGVVNNRDAPPGRASFCRWHVLGTELDFAKDLSLTFELGGARNPSIVERIKTVAYYYQR
ncbi:MAG: hypothetical protein RL701_1217 [Pseudomonadota bacterium]